MNVNYINSFAEQNMIFRSAVEVLELIDEELFYHISVYVPSNVASLVIKNYVQLAPTLTETRPIVISCDVQNYADVMQAGLLTQMQPVFRGDTNTDVVIHLIIFYAEDDGVDRWEWTNTAVNYTPLTAAFEQLYFISYVKQLYDEHMNGDPTDNVPSLGTLSTQMFDMTNASTTQRIEAQVILRVENTSSTAESVPAGTYQGTYNGPSGSYVFNLVVGASGLFVAANGVVTPSARTDSSSALTDIVDTVGQQLSISNPAWPAALIVNVANVISTGQAAGTAVPIQLNPGTYAIPDTVSSTFYFITIDTIVPIIAQGKSPMLKAVSSSPNDEQSADFTTVDWASIPGFISPAPGLTGINIAASAFMGAFTPGSLPGPPITVPSQYFDFSLALSYLCKLNPTLSQFWSLVRVSVGGEGQFPNLPPVTDPTNPTAMGSLIPTDPNNCKIRSASVAEETAGIPSLTLGPELRMNYYWGALKLMQADMTWLMVHSERPVSTLAPTPVTNIISEIWAEWFRAKNESGLYVGNKVHTIRLTGDNIKPFGWPSPLNQSVNQNDTGYGFNTAQTIIDRSGVENVFGPKRVAYLQSISDNSPENCRLTSARLLNGIPVNAQMIAKYVDYRCSMDTANMITDKGSLTNPVLADEEAYGRIQAIVGGNLGRFTATKRIVGITLTFPSFSVAKVGLTAFEAAHAWSAFYVDDLDSVTVSGGISEL